MTPIVAVFIALFPDMTVYLGDGRYFLHIHTNVDGSLRVTDRSPL